MSLAEDLARIAAGVAHRAAAGETLVGIVPVESAAHGRVYVCAYDGAGGRAWLVVDEEGAPVVHREAVREAATLAALCEIAVDAAGGGDLPRLRAELLALRLREQPAGIEEAEEAALALERVVGEQRVASAEYLDAVGAATKRLERALGNTASPFARMVQGGAVSVESLIAEVLANYKVPLT